MGTKPEATIGSALFGKARQAVLGLLFANPDETFYLRQITRSARVGQGAVQRELARLTQAGILERTVRGHQVFYQARRQCPVFAELHGLVIKTAGVAQVLRDALLPLAARLHAAFIHGSFAEGQPGRESDVDVVVVGNVEFSQVVKAFRPAQDRLGREINPSVYSPAELRQKLAAGHHFLTRVWDTPKIFLIGDADELGRLAEKRLADAPQNEQARDRRPARRRRSRPRGLPGQGA